MTETTENYTKEEQKQIAQTIWRQMGGASNLLFGEEDAKPYLQFDFKGSRKHNKCRVMLSANDTYIFQLYKHNRRTASCPKTFELRGAYCNMLVSAFETQTGLYLSL